MRKIILMMLVSLDGSIEGPQRDLDWHKVDDELHRHFNEQLGAMGYAVPQLGHWALSWCFRCSSGRSPILADQALDDVGALDPGGHIDRLAGLVQRGLSSCD